MIAVIGRSIQSWYSCWLPCRQPRPLRHPELVLLIDHREPKILERDALIKQRMRADDDVGSFFPLICRAIK